MAKTRTGSINVVTANRLADGQAVFLAAAGGWVADIGRAAVATEAASAERLLAIAAASVARQEVVDPYLVALAAGEVRPLALRERIRAHGPTVAAIAADATRYPE